MCNQPQGMEFYYGIIEISYLCIQWPVLNFYSDVNEINHVWVTHIKLNIILCLQCAAYLIFNVCY